MENLKLFGRTSKNPSFAFTKVLSRPLYSPFRSSLARTINQPTRSLSRTHKKSPLRGKVSPKRFTPVEKVFKQDYSVSTTASIMKSKVYEEEQNIIKTPTTINEEPLCFISLEDDLRDYFNRNSCKKPQVLVRPKHRYAPSMELAPMRSETPEIPTKISPKSSNLPIVQKKVGKKQGSRNVSPTFRVVPRSQSPYEIRSKSRTRKQK